MELSFWYMIFIYFFFFSEYLTISYDYYDDQDWMKQLPLIDFNKFDNSRIVVSFYHICYSSFKYIAMFSYHKIGWYFPNKIWQTPFAVLNVLCWYSVVFLGKLVQKSTFWTKKYSTSHIMLVAVPGRSESRKNMKISFKKLKLYFTLECDCVCSTWDGLIYNFKFFSEF